MSDTTVRFPAGLADGVAAYVREVRVELADLPSEDVDDLTGGMEADLSELAADCGGDLAGRLGSPSRYARRAAIRGRVAGADSRVWSPHPTADSGDDPRPGVVHDAHAAAPVAPVGHGLPGDPPLGLVGAARPSVGLGSLVHAARRQPQHPAAFVQGVHDGARGHRRQRPAGSRVAAVVGCVTPLARWRQHRRSHSGSRGFGVGGGQ